MKFHMQSARVATTFGYSRWDVALVGETVDDRGREANNFAQDNSKRICRITYDPERLEINIDNNITFAESLEAAIKELKASTFLLEATTLGFAEILFLCRNLMTMGSEKVSLLYTEPQSYNRPRQRFILNRRDFELTDEVQDFTAIPGYALLVSPQKKTKAVFTLGYEGQRLQRALEQIDFQPASCNVIFGVPAFQPGWEMDSFANNVRIMRDHSLEGDVLFAGAENPEATFQSLDRIYSSCGPDERLMLAPIGTKPQGIGVALFACEHNDVGIIYDHPTRAKGRSRAVGTWHLFDVEF